MTDECRRKLIAGVISRVPETEMLAQLAEDAAEVAAAALELRRALENERQKEERSEEARYALRVKLSGVSLVADLLHREDRAVEEMVMDALKDYRLRCWADALTDRER